MRKTNTGSAYIPKQRLINCLSKLGYSFVNSSDRVELYRRPNGAHYVSVPRTRNVSVEFATSVLRQVGMNEDDIRSFLASART